MGPQGTTKETEKENVCQAEKPYRLLMDLYDVLSGPHFSNQDPGWGPKGQPKGQKGKRLTGRKIITTF